MVLSSWVCLVSEGLFGCDVGGVLFLLFFSLQYCVYIGLMQASSIPWD